MDAVTNVHPAIVSRTSAYVQHPSVLPLLFLPVPTVDGRENVSDHEHCTIVAESNAPTPKPNRVDRSTCNMSNKSKPGEALVWESFCEAAASVATSIDCCKTSVQVNHGMVSDSSIILLEVLVPGPRAITCNTFYRNPYNQVDNMGKIEKLLCIM
ncbi:hypothetical protein Trydic_g13154 [Trypoxylus dichotomus]